MAQPARATRHDRRPGRPARGVEVRAAGEEAFIGRSRRRVTVLAPVFPFVQLEYGYRLGPEDGRYLVRSDGADEPRLVVVLNTLGALERRRLRGRRSKEVERGEPEPVPTSRATLVRAQRFESEVDAERWLEGLHDTTDGLRGEVEQGIAELNEVLRAHRAAARDATAREVELAGALVARVGYGAGEDVADGRYARAYELPRGDEARKARRRVHAGPRERFAALLGGKDEILVCDELALRARSDLDAGRPREAALQARVALEAALAELDDPRGELKAARGGVGEAANAALDGEPSAELQQAVREAIGLIEARLSARD